MEGELGDARGEVSGERRWSCACQGTARGSVLSEEEGPGNGLGGSGWLL